MIPMNQSSFVIPQIYPQKLQASKNIPLSTHPSQKKNTLKILNKKNAPPQLWNLCVLSHCFVSS